jgi:hypothetical protein
MTSQALSGVIALRLVSREGSPSLLEVRHTHTHTQLCGCVSFLVVAGNSSQNENTF